MKIIYFPNKGFQIESLVFDWNDSRESAREKLRNRHKEDDRIIEMSEYFGGDTSHDIEQRRDIYYNTLKQKNKFFLNYDKDNRLAELEIHSTIKISVKQVHLELGKDIHEAIEKLVQIGEKYSEIEEGNYLFENLKMSIASSESMGGEGNSLDYFYAGKNIQHLLD